MRFTFRQLEIFVEVAKDQNFRQTADRLGISQPTISNHIRALEERAGGRLFDRKRGSSARLLPHGKDLLVQAKALLHGADKVRFGEVRDGERKTLRVAAGAFIIDHLLRPALARYHMMEGLPNLQLILAEHRDDIPTLLRQRGADFGFYTGDLVNDRELTTKPLCEVRIGLYAAPELAETIDGAEAASAAPMIMAADDTPTDFWFQQILARNGIHPHNVVARSQYPDLILNLALSGTGLALLFEDQAERHWRKGRLAKLPFAFDASSRNLILSTRPTDGPAQKALNFLCEVVSGHATKAHSDWPQTLRMKNTTA